MRIFYNIPFKNNFGDKSASDRWLIIALIIATIAQNYYDLLSIMDGEELALFSYQGPLFIKLGKDICYFMILGAIVWHVKKSKRFPPLGIGFLIFVIVSYLMIVSMYFNGILMAIIGFRWILPFLIFLLMNNWIETVDREFFANFLVAAMVGCFAVQLVQLFIMPPVFGEIGLGLAARTPGFFLAPNSAAFFGCSGAALTMVVYRYRGWLPNISILLAFCIGALAQPGTGLVVALLLALWKICYPKLIKFTFSALLLAPIAFLNLNDITQREDYLELSGGGRIDVLQNIFEESFVSIASFGKYTNAANLLSDNLDSKIAPDSLVAAWIGNFGALWPLVTIVIILFCATKMAKISQNYVTAPVIVFFLFGLTTIIFEAFPMNMIIAIAIWWSRLTAQERGVV